MKKRILCYGDSNTWGYTPGTAVRYGDDVRWTGVVRNILGGGYTILEDGINGRTTVYDQEWAKGRNGLKGLSYSLQSQKPLDLVAVMLGTNDLSMTDMPFVESGLREIVRTLKNADSIYNVSDRIFRDAPRVLLIAPPPYHKNCDYVPGTSITGKYAESCRFPEVCGRIADESGVFYLDGSLYAEVSDIDNCHLTEKGHAELGKAVAAKISEIFGTL